APAWDPPAAPPADPYTFRGGYGPAMAQTPGQGAGSGDPRVPPGTLPAGYGARSAVPGPSASTTSQPAPPYAPDTYAPDTYGAESYSDDSYADDSYYDDDYDEYDDEGGQDGDLRRRRGCRAVLVTLAVLVLVAAAGGWFAWSWVQRKIDPTGEPGETVLVVIPEGSSASDIGHELADAGVISDARVWDWYIRVRDPGSFQAGNYRMQLNSSFSEAIDALDEGALPPDTILITMPEGYTVAQTVARLADPEDGVAGFTAERLSAALAAPESRSAFLPQDQASLEGTLFPESYAVEEGDTEAVVVQRMVAQLDATLTELDVQARAEQLGLTPYQVLTVASLVEKEARVDEDRARVARVIYNRLGDEMPLQIDATSCFAKAEPGCSLTEADLASDSPYNTRNRQGLPPTPIASPGRASIEAALNPAEGDWLFYVIDADANDGSHLFTADYDEFVEAKNRCEAAGLGCG
ncbi:MAG: endolytic transglycosylase MltG, partial [Acidimicrobiales bacterium]